MNEPALTQSMGKRAKIAAAVAAVAAALGGIGIALRSSDYDAAVSPIIADSGMSRSEGATRITDLLTRPVAPGETIETDLMLPLGARVTDVMLAAPFTIVSQTHVDLADGTQYKLTATNSGPAPVRLVGLVSFTVP
jgi:hypothetical protein